MAFAFGVIQSTTCYNRNENRDAHLYKPRHSTWSPPDPPSLRNTNVDETLKQVFPDLSPNSPTTRTPSTQKDKSLCTFLNIGFGPSRMLSTEEWHAFRNTIGKTIEEYRAGVVPRVTFEEYLAMILPEETLGIFEIELEAHGECSCLDSLLRYAPSPSDTQSDLSSLSPWFVVIDKASLPNR